MKMFRNLSIFVLAFLGILVVSFYGCQKEVAQVSPKVSNVQDLQVELRACDQPTYISPLVATQPLFKYRFAAACYRVFARSYQDFHSRSNGNLPAKFFSSDLVRLNISEAQPIIVPLVSAIKKVEYGSNDKAWDAVTQFITDANATMNNGQKETLTRKMNTFDDSSSGFGTYSILFTNGWDYVGKSVVKGDLLTRVIASSTKENCPGSTKMNTNFNGGKDNPPIVADTQYAESVGGSTSSRQAFKEEAVKMFVGNYNLLGKAGTVRTTYNEIASPGVNFIKTDGF
jgi:hypothetical protein